MYRLIPNCNVHNLLGNWYEFVDVDKPLPEGSDTTHAALATRFQRSFTEKVDALCCKRSQQPSDDMATEATARLHVFEPASPSDVKRIVMASAAKSCELDPLPTSLLKTHIDFLCPVLARIINASLSSSVVPPPMKHAVVIPILKKRCSDVNILTNYRPISNIAFVAKLTERFVAQQLQHFMDVNGIYGVYQSSYRPQHSAESALLRIHNDVAQSIDSRRSVFWCCSTSWRLSTQYTTTYSCDDCMATDCVAMCTHG